ncbi:non-ribosomal peptide synthetase module [Cohnella cholangitidis]|uniref:Non-ribosomal peptide synthetase module n=1 Tax=Cohnella cholangitidis TaxID=2598458 RepID=A0A7G5C3K8_9BACL|nr:non-ribosomal peptide synthetase module [Cohnella cholangitidis]QMV43792.1 non-ribosomal peptide synthetase module [Cohnella cholangitidis]
MAQRVATEYVNATLTLTEAEMPRLISLCEFQQLRLQVFVLDNGNQEIVLEEDAGGESIRLTFERTNGQYQCVLTCRVVQPKLTNALRKLVSSFKGDAVVNRIYQGFTMIYHYIQGNVARIVESKGTILRTVFEHKDTLGRLESRFKLFSVEEEISRLRGTVNELLDIRNQTKKPELIAEIDQKLKYHSRLLFALEA